MVGEGKRIDLDMHFSIVIALVDWGKRDLPRQAGLPRFRGEAFRWLPLRILCGLVFKEVGEKEKAKL